MSSANQPLNLVLTRRLPDGGIEWIPLERFERMSTADRAEYALLDRTSYEAPPSLVLSRDGEDLLVEVGGEPAVILDDFFATIGAAFYPTPAVASGEGPFSGVPITPSTSSAGAAGAIVWSAPSDEPTGESAAVAVEAGGPGTTPLLLGGLALGGLGLAFAGGGGGGGGGGASTGASGDSSPPPATPPPATPPPATPAPDTTPPSIESPTTAMPVPEGTAAGSVVYLASASDESPITWSLAPGGDAAAFSIDSATGEVTLLETADFESAPSYSFTVVAADSQGNDSRQTVSLAVIDADENPPEITSPPDAILAENGGTGQVAYRATADDESAIVWALRPGDDAAAFSIDDATGAVTLLAEPDFETQATYQFTVVATDTTGNSTQQQVTLTIVDVDEVPPEVTEVRLAAAIGAENGFLSTGDTVRVAVTMTEATIVDTTGGLPRIALVVGSQTQFADYASGSGTPELIFEYVVQPGDRDNNGIRIRADGLEDNGGTIADAAGNLAILSHDSVPNDPDFRVDTTAPILRTSNPRDGADDVDAGADIELRFSEDVLPGVGNVVISSADDVRTIDVNDGSQVRFEGDRIFVDPDDDLDGNSDYRVEIDAGALLDSAGNSFAGLEGDDAVSFETGTAVDTTVVVFDLVQGVSSSHSDRSFEAGVTYDIYLRVESDEAELSNDGDGPGTWGTWSGARNLGSDDRVFLVGTGDPLEGPFLNADRVSLGDSAVAWSTPFRFDAAVLQADTLLRATGLGGGSREELRLFDRAPPEAFFSNQGGLYSTMYLTSMPAGLLTSQGLA